ncbi:hypothetical protein RHMOL_Rhmol04G0213500 [Rhododendron molle]|uniref:Uncharacterized protein n=1 Tax=Rhododendron molle TaxID=49168 RepID=A0ACC0P512_RHOML|nr:hypothetical protein RHMOL_Rhmol04G0213500 [Rhododendron molle]
MVDSRTPLIMNMGVVITLVKPFGRKPEKRNKWEPLKDDVELCNSSYLRWSLFKSQCPMKEDVFGSFDKIE